MNNKLRENYIRLKINNKKIYLSVLLDTFTDYTNLLDNIAISISSGVDIVELATNNYPQHLLNLGLQVKQLYNIFDDFTLIIKDRADIAHLIEADGISLTCNSIDTNFARQILGDEAIIGCYDYSKNNCDFCISCNPLLDSSIPVFVPYKSTNNSQRIFLNESVLLDNDISQTILSLKKSSQ